MAGEPNGQTPRPTVAQQLFGQHFHPTAFAWGFGNGGRDDKGQRLFTVTFETAIGRFCVFITEADARQWIAQLQQLVTGLVLPDNP